MLLIPPILLMSIAFKKKNLVNQQQTSSAFHTNYFTFSGMVRKFTKLKSLFSTADAIQKVASLSVREVTKNGRCFFSIVRSDSIHFF